MADAAPEEKIRPAKSGITVWTVVTFQVLAVVFSGMIIDGGWLAGIMAISVVCSWLISGITVLIGHRAQAVRVMVWSWILGVVVCSILVPQSELSRGGAKRAQMSSNLNQLVRACQHYAGEDSQRAWPSDIPRLLQWSEGELSLKLVKSSLYGDVADPIVYVRPISTATAVQPVFLSNPACAKNGGIIICYAADGHTVYMSDRERAAAVWAEAKRLANSEKARTTGIELTDWHELTDKVTR